MITEFIDVEGFMEFLMDAAEEINKSRIGKIRAPITRFTAHQ